MGSNAASTEPMYVQGPEHPLFRERFGSRSHSCRKRPPPVLLSDLRSKNELTAFAETEKGLTAQLVTISRQLATWQKMREGEAEDEVIAGRHPHLEVSRWIFRDCGSSLV